MMLKQEWGQRYNSLIIVDDITLSIGKQIIPKISSFTLPWPVDWTEIFGVERPLILDIGFGYGHTLEHLHKTQPKANIIGVEVDNFCLTKAEKAIVRKGMFNVRVVRSRAETALHHLFAPNSLSEIHINFPDPWFKLRHSARRLMQRDTLDAMVNRLARGGVLYLATDIVAYAQMSTELLENTPGLTNMHDTSWVDYLPGRIMTKYEKKARKAGRDCYYFAYQRNDIPGPDVPIVKEFEMPHIVISSPLMLEEFLEKFEPQDSYAIGETRIIFMDTYRNDNAILFELHVREPTIDQRLALVLTKRKQANEYTLKFNMLGTPRPTVGLHKAVGILGEILVGMHKDSKVLKSTVKR